MRAGGDRLSRALLTTVSVATLMALGALIQPGPALAAGPGFECRRYELAPTAARRQTPQRARLAARMRRYIRSGAADDATAIGNNSQAHPTAARRSARCHGQRLATRIPPRSAPTPSSTPTAARPSARARRFSTAPITASPSASTPPSTTTIAAVLPSAPTRSSTPGRHGDRRRAPRSVNAATGVAVGRSATADGAQSIAIGADQDDPGTVGAHAGGNQSIAIGADSEALGMTRSPWVMMRLRRIPGPLRSATPRPRRWAPPQSARTLPPTSRTRRPSATTPTRRAPIQRRSATSPKPSAPTAPRRARPRKRSARTRRRPGQLSQATGDNSTATGQDALASQENATATGQSSVRRSASTPRRPARAPWRSATIDGDGPAVGAAGETTATGQARRSLRHQRRTATGQLCRQRGELHRRPASNSLRGRVGPDIERRPAQLSRRPPANDVDGDGPGLGGCHRRELDGDRPGVSAGHRQRTPTATGQDSARTDRRRPGSSRRPPATNSTATGQDSEASGPNSYGTGQLSRPPATTRRRQARRQLRTIDGDRSALAGHRREPTATGQDSSADGQLLARAILDGDGARRLAHRPARSSQYDNATALGQNAQATNDDATALGQGSPPVATRAAPWA